LYWALALVIACGAPPPPTSKPAATLAVAAVPADATPAPVLSAPPPPTAHYGAGEIETNCNGIDDDGDGVTDLLLPVAPNRCDTHLPGACGHGFAACEDGKLVCLAPPPMPEVANGIDDDCNGVVDDVAPRKTRPRVLVAAPRYAWKDAGADLATVTATLAQGGIPYDEQAASTDWREALHGLDNYAAVVVPGYLIGEVVAPDIAAMLETFAERGGVVVVWKPIGKDDARAAWQLTGLRSATRHRDVAEIRFTGAAPITAAIDSPEERRLAINSHVAPDAVEVWVLDPDPAANTETLAAAYVDGAAVGAAITRRRIGKGSIYAIGHDLATFDAARCYVNCFEPSGDVLRLVLEGALREGAGGHVVLKHTAPSEASSVLVLTHDIDAPDSQGSGDWGEAGALQAARLEHARGMRATFNITTDYIAGYFNPSVLTELCTLGMCPLGAHSVQHGSNFGLLRYGTCTEKRDTYGKSPTLCGEIHVSSELIRKAIGTAPRVWRAPYLAINPRQFEALDHEHFAYDSGFGVGDLPWNLPLDLAAVGFHQDRFRHVPMLELPVACEDGIDHVVAGGKHERIELQASNHAEFIALWRYILVQNARNRSFTTLLMHPSRGRDQPHDNVGVKIRALGEFLDDAALEDVTVRSFEDIGDFWRARLATGLDASYDAGSYTGTITADKVAAPAGFTLEFGDAIKSFTCEHCGATRIHGNRVVIVAALPAHTTATFVARTR
jgi:peptidoglycan/xylan/chitin deacetylase (PgdA/CDA1 family)